MVVSGAVRIFFDTRVLSVLLHSFDLSSLSRAMYKLRKSGPECSYVCIGNKSSRQHCATIHNIYQSMNGFSISGLPQRQFINSERFKELKHKVGFSPE